MSVPRSDRISLVHGAVAAIGTAVLAALYALSSEPITPGLIAFFVLVVSFLWASALDAVREHPLYDVAEGAWLVALFSAWILSGRETGVVPIVLLAGAVVALLVEVYNYATGASLFRIEWGQ